MGTERGGSTDPPQKKTNSLVCLFSPPLFCVHSPSTLFHFPLMSLSSFLPPSISFNEEEKGKSLVTWKGKSPIHRPPKSETHTLFPLSLVSPSSSAATYYSEKWAGIKKKCVSLSCCLSVRLPFPQSTVARRGTLACFYFSFPLPLFFVSLHSSPSFLFLLTPPFPSPPFLAHGKKERRKRLFLVTCSGSSSPSQQQEEHDRYRDSAPLFPLFSL